jgi:ABC-type sugar transport system substrate-binding protein
MSSPANEKVRIFLSLMTADNDYQREQALTAEEAARTRKIDLEIAYASGDAVEQSQQIIKAIQRPKSSRPDAIVVEPVGTAMPKVARAAASAGVGWVLLNRNADYLSELHGCSQSPVCAVTCDNSEVGMIQAKQLEELLQNGGAVLYIEGPSSSEAAQQRKAGLVDTLSSRIELKCIRAAWTEASAHACVSSWLKLSTSRSLHVVAVGCQNDAMAMGARRAFSEVLDANKRKQWLRMPFTGCDGVLRTGQTWVREGLLTCTIIIPPITALALEIISKALRTGAAPPAHTSIRPESFPPLEHLADRWYRQRANLVENGTAE